MHIFLKNSVYWTFKTNKKDFVNKINKAYTPAITTRICNHNYNLKNLYNFFGYIFIDLEKIKINI